MRNRVLIKVGLILEFLAELLYFIAIVYPRYFGFILILLITSIYVVSSIMMYLGFNGPGYSLSIGSIGAVLLMLGSSLLLIVHLTSTSYVVAMIGMGIAFLGDVSISLFFWRASQGDIFIKVGAVLNVVPVVTFIGSLLLAIGIDSVKDLS